MKCVKSSKVPGWQIVSEIEKMYYVDVNDSAKLMMLEHITFLSQVNVTAAEKLYEDFEKAFDSLSKFPHICPVFDTPYTSSEYRRLVIDRYVLLFTIDNQKNIVHVEYIWDSRQGNTLL